MNIEYVEATWIHSRKSFSGFGESYEVHLDVNLKEANNKENSFSKLISFQLFKSMLCLSSLFVYILSFKDVLILTYWSGNCFWQQFNFSRNHF